MSAWPCSRCRSRGSRHAGRERSIVQRSQVSSQWLLHARLAMGNPLVGDAKAVISSLPKIRSTFPRRAPSGQTQAHGIRTSRAANDKVGSPEPRPGCGGTCGTWVARIPACTCRCSSRFAWSGHSLQPAAAIQLDIRRDVGIPPMAVGHDVGKNPAVAGQLLIAASGPAPRRETSLSERR